MSTNAPNKFSAECVLNIGARLAEGPHWWESRGLLIWVDNEDSRIGLFDPVSRTNSFIHLDSHVGCVVPTDRGNLLAATSDGYKFINFLSGKVTSIGDPEKHRVGNRFNDGKCDPWGRFWAGSMNYALSPNAGSLWRLDASLKFDFSCELFKL